MSNTSVQLEGVENVIGSYRNRKVPAFAIFQGKDMNFFYAGNDMQEGEEQLTGFLEMIQNSKAVYRLKVYHDSDIKNGIVRSSTPDIGAVNFRLNLDPVGSAGGYIGAPGNYAQIREMQREIERLREQVETQGAEDPEGIEAAENSTIAGIQNVIGVVKEVMGIPGVADLVGGLLRGIMTRAGAPAGYGINGLPAAESVNNFYSQFEEKEAMNTPTTNGEDLNGADIERAAIAYVHISKAYPEFLELLEKIAMKAQTDPGAVRSQLNTAKNFL